jgi:CheY-like chemotaxis protein
VFDRFRQADSSFTRKHGGLGLGLSIARQLIEMHGGTIRAESPGLDQGATFTVDLRLAEAQPAPAASAPSDEHSANGNGAALPAPRDPFYPDQPLHGLRVLLVEDEHATRTALTRLLRRAGAVVVPVPSAAAARAAYRASPPDILLSDISMPGEDGCALLRRLRAMDRKRLTKKTVRREMKRSLSEDRISHPDFPAVALTAHARPKDIDDTRRAGFQAHLSKPIEPERLITLLAELAAGHVVQRSVVP